MSTRLSPPPSVETPRLPELDAPQVQPAPPARRQIIVGPQPARRRANGALLFSLVVALAGAIGLLYVYQTSMVAGLGLDLTRLQRDIDAAAVRNEELSYQLAYYEALPLIEQIAVEDRGMEPMASSIFVTVTRPADEDLPLPEPRVVDEPSRVQQVLERLFGRGAADDAEATQP